MRDEELYKRIKDALLGSNLISIWVDKTFDIEFKVYVHGGDNDSNYTYSNADMAIRDFLTFSDEEGVRNVWLGVILTDMQQLVVRYDDARDETVDGTGFHITRGGITAGGGNMYLSMTEAVARYQDHVVKHKLIEFLEE